MLLVRHGQSQFNAVFGLTRQDPGIEDPELTAEGVLQARAAGEKMAAMRRDGEADIRRLISSPYLRALQTAAIIAEILDVTVTIEPLVRERAAYKCDIGAPPIILKRRFPAWTFEHLEHPWWHDLAKLGMEESEDVLQDRGRAFCAAMHREPDWPNVAVVTHWGFIRCLTQRADRGPVNGEIVRVQLPL